jgi:hypothetical protein
MTAPTNSGTPGARFRGLSRASTSEIDVSGTASAPNPHHVDIAVSDGRYHQSIPPYATTTEES